MYILWLAILPHPDSPLRSSASFKYFDQIFQIMFKYRICIIGPFHQLTGRGESVDHERLVLA